MNEDFQSIVNKMPEFMKLILAKPFSNRDSLGKLPVKGIYIFFENKEAVYVGRSNRLRKRLLEHSRQGSTHNSASFAFNLAKKEAEKLMINIDKKRSELEADGTFKDLFYNAKNRVSKMEIKVLEIENQIEQAIFEIYAAIELQTDSDFGTH